MEHYYFEKVTLESLIAFIEGKCEEPEKQTINNWIDTDPKNKKFFDQISEAWLTRNEIIGLRKENIDIDFENVLQKIHLMDVQETHKSLLSGKRNYLKIFTRVAAVIILVISTGIAYYLGQGKRLIDLSSNQDILAYNEVIVPVGQRSQVILSDGTEVWVNAGSKLRFRNQFQGNIREVWLDGEGYFDVAKDASRLFYVHTSDLDIKVHGTIFNLKAYSTEDIIETTLVEGSVSFEINNSDKKKGKDVFLEPNQKAIYLKSKTALVTEEVKREVSEPLEPQKIVISDPIDVAPVVSWTEGKLIFNDESLANVAIKLERKYDLKINIQNEEIKEIRFTGVLKNLPIEQTLNSLKLSLGIQYTIKENIVHISKN